MSEFSLFMKANKIAKTNEFYAATESLRDKNGEPLKWELRHISSIENEEIRDECLDEDNNLNLSKYIRKLVAASVATPDLYDEKLQESYNVNTPEALLAAMVDSPGEYNRMATFVQHMNGFDVSFEKKVKEAKN